ncbi:lycopene cyclase domain-containing protein [Promicromonospora umidemergens]|uniref:Lycopene cyclase domain-containing protein n=1 Tax=Promicromonospora umidemergens TaxID=629679 RepID=A0ABP8XKE2_9MICO|nr:lycopene cyclase domain-containing protein [Promicromonospora umidemergens]MCP2285645.1 lycopene cyclase domain-containing protein [Promicromonospora umidemergens]
MSLAYLAVLLVSAAGVLLLDRRYRLFCWQDPARAAAVLALGAVFFLLWDLAGIGLGVFFHGSGRYMTGLMLAPELPVEELVFLLFLCELTMVLVLGAQRVLHRSSRRGDRRRDERAREREDGLR